VTTLARHRRNVELTLGLLTIVVTMGGYVLVALADGPELPPDLFLLLGAVFGLYLVAHLTIRRVAPAADGTLLPLAAVLNGIGFVTIARLDRELARIQSVWVAVAVAAFVATLVLVRDLRTLERYRYTFALLGIGCLLLPLVPGIGREINGARLWVSLGALNFQPGEAAKVLLVVFFAAYLVDKRELLSAGSFRVAGLYLPAPRHLGPLLLAWGFSIVVMVMEKDLGSSLLFFAVFAAMLYMATGRLVYMVVALVLFVAAAVIAYQLFDHVQVRVETWLDPWPTARDEGYQITQSWFAFGTGGVAGTGLGLGNPDKIPNAATDFVFSAVGEELGLVGTLGVLCCYILFVGSALRVAVDAPRPFPKLFAAGLATIVGVQTLIILGGVTRIIPLTGITLPFVSYGGSSLVANFVLLALILRISHDTIAGPRPTRAASPRDRAGAAT
jgi:peptidoglycan glycosyltransferase